MTNSLANFPKLLAQAKEAVAAAGKALLHPVGVNDSPVEVSTPTTKTKEAAVAAIRAAFAKAIEANSGTCNSDAVVAIPSDVMQLAQYSSRRPTKDNNNLMWDPAGFKGTATLYECRK